MILDRRPVVLVVEDNETTARSLRLFLEAADLEVLHTPTARMGLEAVFSREPDLILLDLNLPDRDGLDLCDDILDQTDVPIIMLTARTSESDIVKGLEAGAIDYVRKPFGSRELLARVKRQLVPRQSVACEDLIRIGELQIDRMGRSVKHADHAVSLTKSEFDILLALAERPGQVFTRGQLISRALGDDFEGFDRTIDTHIWSIRKKLGETRSSPRYILSEVGVGYRMNPDA